MDGINYHNNNLNDRTQVWNCLDWNLCFKNSELQEEFFLFCRSNKLNGILLCSIIYFSTLVIPLNIVALCFNQSSGGIIFAILNCLLAVVMTYSGWSIFFESKYGKDSVPFLRVQHIVHVLGIFCYFILCTYRGLFQDTCGAIPHSLQPFIVGWHCNFNFLLIPPYLLPALVLCPLVIILTMNESRADVVLLGLATGTVFFIAFSTLGNNMTIVWCTVVTVIFTFAVCVELHMSRMFNFLRYKKLQETLLENQRMHEQGKATELRNMIGNLAHDLKTPLSSFIAGIDLIGHTLQDMESNILTLTNDNTHHIQQAINTMTQCFKNIRNTHSFMLMAINRCIDYTKASRGLTLSPKNDTIDLMEMLIMPLECISNIQDRCSVQILPVSADICNHVITDKQWLLENLLCLLSNAVKYSSDGVVTIGIQLINEEEELENDCNDIESCNELDKKIPQRGSFYRSSSHSSIFGGKSIFETVSQRQIHPAIVLSTEYSDISSFSSVTISKQRLRFEIEDTGIGIDQEAMKNLFNPFQRAQSLAGGTGLGLYSLAMRMDGIKGRYGVQGRRDGKQGSLFWFEIPYRPDIGAAMLQYGNPSLKVSLEKFNFEPFRVTLRKQLESINSPPKNHSTLAVKISFHDQNDFAGSIVGDDPKFLASGNQQQSTNQLSSSNSSFRSTYTGIPLPMVNSWNILLVDDSAPILKMVKMMLTHQGHKVVLAENGQIAVEKTETLWKTDGKLFDVILMDLQMPVMDGLEATKRIRQLEQQILPPESSHRLGIAERVEISTNRINTENDVDSVLLPTVATHQVIIGMSANSDGETMQQILFAGADDFIPKPFHVDVFTKTVLRYMKI